MTATPLTRTDLEYLEGLVRREIARKRTDLRGFRKRDGQTLEDARPGAVRDSGVDRVQGEGSRAARRDVGAAVVTVLDPLPGELPDVVFVPMLTTSHAVDLYLGDLTRRSRSKTGRTADSYRRILYQFVDTLRPGEDVTAITADDCRRFLDRFNRLAAGTQATNYSILNSFLEWVYLQQRIKRNPLDHVPRPRRLPSEDLDVVTIAVEDVPKLLAAACTHTERLAVAIPAYLGPRRGAVAQLRLRDYDRRDGTIRFFEKGSKTIWKPAPAELLELIDAAIEPGEPPLLEQHLRGTITAPDDYLVPPEGPLMRAGDRDDRVIWRVVKRVADRAGVNAHVHALRAAFATFYLESHTGDTEALQALMGHRQLSTTQIYLRRLDRKAAMERVRGLSWAGVGSGNMAGALLSQVAGNGLASSPVMGAGGFEPPYEDSRGVERADSESRPKAPT